MKAVILAGGYGTRFSEKTVDMPKPMIEIGGRPILWHIMKIYSHYGINDFIVCAGYKKEIIQEYFKGYPNVTIVDTGENTQTGGRLKKIQSFVNGESFCLTYGDGVSDVNIRKLIRFHKSHGRQATITAVRPPGRFGALEIDENDFVTRFVEKPKDGWINGGFFVFENSIFDLIQSDRTRLEKKPLEQLAESSELKCFKHGGFWQPMDTLRDHTKLEELWAADEAPWRVWDELLEG